MKQFVISILLVLLFSSCGSLPHFEKRVYRSGFYIERNEKKVKQIAVAAIIRPIKIQESLTVHNTIPFVSELIKQNFSSKKMEVKKNVHFSEHKTQRSIIPPPIVLPKGDPVNKKAKAAYILFVIARLFMFGAFVLLLCSLVVPFLFVAGAAIVVALTAVLFGVWAKKELAKEEPTELEAGGAKAQYVIERAAAWMVYFTVMILLAVFVDWIERQNGK